MNNSFTPQLLSVIIRFHDSQKLSILEEALDSLFTQSYRLLEVCLILQNFPLDQELRVKHFIDHFIDSKNHQSALNSFLPPLPQLKLLNLRTPPDQDSRTELLNAGLGMATGQYIAFLDYDDIVLPGGYSLLLRQAQRSTAAVIVGGCKVVKRVQKAKDSAPSSSLQPLSAPQWDSSSEIYDYYSWGTGIIDLVWNNFLPIHSFIIDRSKLKPTPPHQPVTFDASLIRCEDYDFLLNLASQYAFDFTYLKIPVCEYRFRDDGSNTTVLTRDYSSSQATQLWIDAIHKINHRKKNLFIQVNMLELSLLREQLNQANVRENALKSELSKIEHVVADRLTRRWRNIVNRIPLLKSILKKFLRLLGK